MLCTFAFAEHSRKDGTAALFFYFFYCSYNNFAPFIGEMKASDRTVSRHFHNLMKGYTMKDLRHTFISRCQMCGVPENVVRLWAGHSPKGITQSVYTHFDDEFLTKEGQKISYKI